ncbi:DNA cytosine methyltransferase [Rhizobium johnstonii]|uniref:DNA cytosine methyltransferase n=1 Tax=Rhizobium johnstonii TaxID=3019933 RepID=UPI003F960A07
MIIDSFAGGGGASTGIEMALGRSPDLAINHNAAALALHAANHPQTLHLSENIYKVDPLDYVAGRHVGLAWFSPDCKHFSKAKGGKPVERNIRDLAHIIPYWVSRIQKSGGKIDVIIMENVEEFSTWGPLIETEKGLMPDPARRGETFQKWCKELRGLGGKIEKRELRACDYGAPTIRKRLFVIIRFDRQKITWPEPTHGAPNDPDVAAGHKLPWRTAAEIIDWSLPCPSIFDTGDQVFSKHGLRAVRPLADNTMARVARGMKRYVIDADRPFIVNLTHGARCEDAAAPFNTITGANRGEKAVVSPHLASYYSHGDGRAERVSEVDDPLATITAENRHAVIAPHLMTMRNAGKPFNGADEPTHTITAGGAGLAAVAPHLMSMKGSERRDSPADAPHPTVLAGGGHSAVVMPYLVPRYGERDGQEPRTRSVEQPAPVVVPTGNGASLVSAVISAAQHGGSVRSVADPHHTITASGKDQNAVIIPTLVGCGGRAGQSRPRSGDEPLATVTAKADVCVTAAFLAQNNYLEPGHDAREPVSTIVGKGSTQSVVSAFVSRQFGASVGHDVDEPSATVTAGVNKSALVAPYLQAYYGTGDGGEEDRPTRTITTKDRHGHVQAQLNVPPFTENQVGRAREVAEFLRSHGFWDGREFVTIDLDGETFVIVDVGMRMLTPRELYNAQGFPPDYIIDGDGEGKVFPKSVQVSCVGNSVSPPVARALVAANCPQLVSIREAAE